jgi:hypothetical protein
LQLQVASLELSSLMTDDGLREQLAASQRAGSIAPVGATD